MLAWYRCWVYSGIQRSGACPTLTCRPSSLGFVASFGSPAQFKLLNGGIHVPIKNVLGLCYGSGDVSAYIRGQNQARVQPDVEQSDGSAYRTGNTIRQCNLHFWSARWELGEGLERACHRVQPLGLRVFLVWVYLDCELFSRAAASLRSAKHIGAAKF